MKRIIQYMDPVKEADGIATRKLLMELGHYDPLRGGPTLDRIHMHNKDKSFVTQHLNELRGPTHKSYRFDVLDTYRLRKIPNSEPFPSDISPPLLLLMGMPKHYVFEIIDEGMQDFSTAKSIFGRGGYYFTNCSSKAANYTCKDAWAKGRAPDKGIIQPKHGDVGIILYCEVALGCTRIKNAITAERRYTLEDIDSYVSQGLYVPHFTERGIADGGYKVFIPRGPIIRNPDVENSPDASFYDDVFVEDVKQINPRILCKVRFDYGKR